MTSDTAKGIIVAIIGAVASLAVAMIGQDGLIDRFYSPVVEVALNKSKEETTGLWNVIATVTNYGSQPATNLTLSFKAPATNKFMNITNDFSTTDIAVRNFGKGLQKVQLLVGDTIPIPALNTRQTYVEVNTPKFNHGLGSKIVLALKVEDEPKLDSDSSEFDASAIYDQGSTRWVKAGDWTYKGFVDNVSKPVHIIEITVTAGFLAWYLAHWAYFGSQPIKTKNRKAITGIVIAVLATIVVLYELVDRNDITSSQAAVILFIEAIIITAIVIVLWKKGKIGRYTW